MTNALALAKLKTTQAVAWAIYWVASAARHIAWKAAQAVEVIYWVASAVRRTAWKAAQAAEATYCEVTERTKQ